MKPTTVHDTIIAWVNSCQTEEQLQTCYEFVTQRLVIEDKHRDDLVQYIIDNDIRRDWVRAAIIRHERFPCDDEFQGDMINH